MKIQTFPALACVPFLLALGACIFVVDGNGHVRHALEMDDHHDHGHHDTTRGSGVSKTESRTVGDFQKIIVEGSADLSVVVGQATSVAVTGDDNLVSWITTEVREGSLVIGTRSGSYSSKLGLDVAVTVPALEALSIRGSSDADLSELAGPSFSVEILGSGDVRARGKVEQLDVSIAGSGDLKLDGLDAREAKVAISGSGAVDVSATELLTVSIAGSGDVRYRGEPKVTKSIAGSGSISKR